MKKNMEKGRSMIEMLGVLAVIGVLTVTGFSMVDKMRKNHQSTRVIDDIANVLQKTRVFLREYEDGENVCRHSTDCSIVEKMDREEMVPDGLEYEDKKLVNLDDVRFYVDYVRPSESDKTLSFILYIENLTEEMCMKVATANWGDVSSTGFINMVVNNTSLASGVVITKATQHCVDGSTIKMGYR